MVRTLTTERTLIKAGRAQWDVGASVRSYLERLRTTKAGKGRPSQANTDLKAEQLRLTTAKAEQVEMKNQQQAGELVDRASVLREWQAALADLRSSLLAIPSRLQGIDRAAIIRIDGEIRACLQELADG